MMEPLKIGNITLKNQLILAPMAGVNCTAFRQLCHEYGAALVYTQLYDSDGLVAIYDSDKEKFKNLVNISEQEKPVSIQLIGSNPITMGQSAQILSKYADIIDINLGCPDKEFLAKQSGAFFSKHPEQIKKITLPVLENSKVPVTAKIRIGWDENTITVLEQCKILEELGVNAIAIHARTRKQVYEGKADWEWIKKAKEQSTVPIIGNGDITKPGAAKVMLDYTKCDFVMIGRAVMGDPLIFERTNYLLTHGSGKEEPSIEERKKAFLRFAELYRKLQQKGSISEFKQHAMWFTTLIRGSRRARENLMKMKDFDQIVDFMADYLSANSINTINKAN